MKYMYILQTGVMNIETCLFFTLTKRLLLWARWQDDTNVTQVCTR